MEYRRDLDRPLAPVGYPVDRLGSISNLTDAVGEARDAYRFDAFGTEALPAGLDDNPFRFSGSSGTAHEPAVPGLVRMGFRYYDAEVGRFISRDPIGFLGGDVNRYAYVGNNPATFVDLDGLSRGNPLAYGLRILQWLGEDYHWAAVGAAVAGIAFTGGVALWMAPAVVEGSSLAAPLLATTLMAGGFSLDTAFTTIGVIHSARQCSRGTGSACSSSVVSTASYPVGLVPGPVGIAATSAPVLHDALILPVFEKIMRTLGLLR